MKKRVVLAVPDLAQEPLIVAALFDPTATFEIVRRCVDAIDLVGALKHSDCATAVISPGLPRLSAALLAEALATGVDIIGVIKQGDEEGLHQLHQLGVISVVTVPDADVLSQAQVIARAIDASMHRPDIATTEHVATQPIKPESAAVSIPRSRGCLIAVWGPMGAPGRTSVAIGLADELSRLHHPALLIDADVYGAAVALSLGVFEEASGLAIACRQAESAEFDTADLALCARSLNDYWRILTGVQRASRATELRPRGLARVWEMARGTPGYTIVDVGAFIDVDAQWSPDRHQPNPGHVARSALDAADIVIAVGSADPVGMDRLRQGLQTLTDLRADPPMVVVTKIRRSVLGRGPHQQIQQVLAEYPAMSSVTLVEDDRAAYDLALRDGRTLAEAAPRSPARTALRELAEALTAAPALVSAT